MLDSATSTASLRRDRVVLSVVGSILVCFVWASLMLSPLSLVLALGFVAVATVVIVTPHRPEWGLVGLMGAAALDVTGRLLSVGGAQITLYQVGALAMVVFVAWRIRQGTFRIVSTPIDLPAAAFLVVAAVSVLLAADPRRALVGLVSLVSSVLLVYVVVVVVDSEDRARTLVFGLVGLGVLWGTFAFAEARGLVGIGAPVIAYPDIIRAKVTFDDPNVLGEFLMTIALLALPLAVARGSTTRRVLCGAGALVCAAGLFATSSRGAVASFFVGGLVLVLFARVPRRYKVGMLVGAALALAIIFALVLDPLWIQDRILNVAQDPSWLARVQMSRAALDMSADHPLGVGAANYPLVYPFYRVGDVRSSLVESHTMLATVLVEYGVIGLGILLWLLWRYVSRVTLAALRAPDGDTHSMLVGVLAAGIALLAQSFTYSLETSKFLWFVIGFGMALVAIVRVRSEETA